MTTPESSELITCNACQHQVDEELAIVGVDVEFQGTMPLLVVFFRCPLCSHEWTDAHEPLNRPDLPNDTISDPNRKPQERED